MAQTLILINGRGGSGKTTIGQLLLKELPSSAFVDFDSLTAVNPFEYGEALFELGHRNAASIVNNYLEAEYDFVIMSSGCGCQSHVDNLLGQIKRDPLIVWVYLDASPACRKTRKLARNRDEADESQWFEFLEAKVSDHHGPVKGTHIQSLSLDTEGRSASDIALDLARTFKENAE